MVGLEAHGLLLCVLLVFAIFAILQSMEWPAPDYQNSLDFMNETGPKGDHAPLLMKNMI